MIIKYVAHTVNNKLTVKQVTVQKAVTQPEKDFHKLLANGAKSALEAMKVFQVDGTITEDTEKNSGAS